MIKPAIFDTIEAILPDALEARMLFPSCCVKTCGFAGARLLSVRRKDGRIDVYAFCRKDAKRFHDLHPSLIEDPNPQGVFLYAT